MLGIGGPELLVILILSFLLTLAALVDILRSNFKGNNDKLIWVVVVIFFPILGPILYFLIGTKQKIPTRK